MSKGTNTVQTQSAPPQQILDAYTHLINAGQAQASQPLSQYGGPMVAGFTPDQQQAFSTINNAQGVAQPYINAGATAIGNASGPITPNGLISGSDLSGLASTGLNFTNQAGNTGIAAAGAGNIADATGAAGTNVYGSLPQFNQQNLDQYLSPFTNGQVAATQAEFNNQNAQTAEGIKSNAIKAGAFGGDRADVAQGIAAGQEQLAQAPVIAGLQQNAYQQAQGQFNQQEQLQASTEQQRAALQAQTGLSAAGLQQGAAGQQGQLGLSAAQQLYGLFGGQQQTGLAADQASGWLGENAGSMLAGLGSQAENTALTGASAQLQSGGQQQGLAQEQLNIPYEQFLAQQAYPYQNLNFLAGLTTGAGSQAGGSSSTTGPGPNLLSQLGGLGLAGVGLAGQTGLFSGAGAAAGGAGAAALGTGAAAEGGFDALAALPLLAKRGGRIGYDGGGLVPPTEIGADPNTKNMFGQFAAMPEEQLREMAVRLPANSPQGAMVRKALAQKQMMPGLAAASPGMAMGGRARFPTGGTAKAPAFSFGSGPDGLPTQAEAMKDPAGFGNAIQAVSSAKDLSVPDMQYLAGIGLAANPGNQDWASSYNTWSQAPGGTGKGVPVSSGKAGVTVTPTYGVNIPQVDQSQFARPQGWDAGGGSPGWFQPLAQYQPSGTTVTSNSDGTTSKKFPSFSTPLPKSITDAIAPPPAAPAPASDATGLASSLTPDEIAQLRLSADQGITRAQNGDKKGGRVAYDDGGEVLDPSIYGDPIDADTARTMLPESSRPASPDRRSIAAKFGDYILDHDPLSGGLSGLPQANADDTGLAAPQIFGRPKSIASPRIPGGVNLPLRNADDPGISPADAAKMLGRPGAAIPPQDNSDRWHGLTPPMARDSDYANNKDIAPAGIAPTEPDVPDAHDAVEVTGLEEGRSEPGLAGARPTASASPPKGKGPPPAPSLADASAIGSTPTALAPKSTIDATGLAAAAPKAPREEYQPGKPDPWMSLIAAGGAMMASKSPYALSGLGAGVQAGAKEYERENELDAKPEVDHSGETVRIYYPSEKKWIDTGIPTAETSRTAATVADAKARLAQTGAFQTRTLDLQQQRADQAAKEASQRIGISQQELGLRRDQLEQGRFSIQPGMGADPNDPTKQVMGAYKTNSKTGDTEFVPGLKLTPKSAISAMPSLGEGTIRLLAEQNAAGDPSGLTGLGQGAVGAANRAAVLDEVARMSADKGTTGADRAATSAEFFGTKAGERTLGNRAANIGMAVSEAKALIPQALETSAKVDRTQFPTLNSMLTAAEKGVGDENVVRASIATNSLVTTYAQVMARSGVPTVDGNKHARELLSTAWSKGQYAAGVDQLMKEMTAAQTSPGAVRQELRGAITGKDQGQPGAPAPSGLAMPSSKADLVKGQQYSTSRGLATWDGSQFVQ